MLRFLLTYGCGVISGMYLEQHYKVPDVKTLYPKCKEIFERIFPPKDSE